MSIEIVKATNFLYLLYKNIFMNKSTLNQRRVIDRSIQKTSLKLESISNSISSDFLVQEELAKAITLLKRVERCLIVANRKEDRSREQQLRVVASSLGIAIALLKQSPDKFLLARRLRRDSEFAVREFTNPIIGRLINGFKYVLYESTTPVKVLFGLCLALPVYLTIPQLPYQRIIVEPLLTRVIAENQPSELSPPAISRYDIDRTIALLVIVGAAGSLGSIISILTRIKEYENEKYSDTLLPVLIGAFKPLIGGASGIFLFTITSSGLLPLELKDNAGSINEWYAFFGIAFVAGFSERLVKDIISQAEGKVTTSRTTPTLIQAEEKVLAATETTSGKTEKVLATPEITSNNED